jgi:hypothetical protein
MKATLKVLLYVGLSLFGLIAVLLLAFGAWIRWQYHLPSDQRAREHFVSHKADFDRFAALLLQDPGAKMIVPGGEVDPYGPLARYVPAYSDLIHKIGAKGVFVRPDGAIEFELWGYGCAPCTDSFKGIRFAPIGGHPRYPYGGAPQTVRSLEDKDLPKDHGVVADGLYVIPLDDQWSIYRAQISD